MISSAESSRSWRGLSIRLNEPELSVGRELVGPTEDMKERMFGSSAMIAATARCFSAMAAKEMSCAPSVVAEICPLSPLGRKPLGIWLNRIPLKTTDNTKPRITQRGWRMA